MEMIHISELSKMKNGQRIFTVGWFHDYSPLHNTCILRSGEANCNDTVELDVSSCAMDELYEVHEYCLCRIIGVIVLTDISIKIKVQSIHATPSWDYCNISKRLDLNKSLLNNA